MTWHDILFALLLLLVVGKLGLAKVRHWIWAHPVLVTAHAIAVQSLGYLISLSQSASWTKKVVIDLDREVPDILKYFMTAGVAITDMAITVTVLLRKQSKANVGINAAALLSRGSRAHYEAELRRYGVDDPPEKTIDKLRKFRTQCRNPQLNKTYDDLIADLTKDK